MVLRLYLLYLLTGLLKVCAAPAIAVVQRDTFTSVGT